MGEIDYLKRNRKDAERIIMVIYSIYTVAMTIASIILKWSSWVVPIIFSGMLLAWIGYIKGIRTYKFRAFLIAGLSLMNFTIYGIFTESFIGILSTFGALVILLGIYNIPEIIYMEIFFSLFLLAYHVFFRQTIPFGTASEQIRSILQILSLFVIEGVTYYLIKTHGETNQKLYEVIENLKIAERSKSDFLANMSHEIRTPINTVCGMSEMILREDISDSVREDTFNIQAAGRNLLSIVSDVLDFSELESGKMELVEEPYNLTSTINDVINMAIAQKAGKNLELIVDCDAKIPYSLLGDEQKLRRVILSFVNNAIKFTESGCITIIVSGRREEYGINLSIKVKDTGIGIAEENLERLFQSFNQVDTKRNRQEGGIGIGLAIAKRIVSKMGGFINVKSELGKGSEFQFVVPQKVLDDRPMVAVKEPENINIIGYINSEKYAFAEIRDDYMRNIRHMVKGLDVRYRACRNLQEFKRRMEKEIFTHAFITIDEYREDMEYFDEISGQLEIVLIQERENAVVPGGNIRSVYKPFYVLSIASVLNGENMIQRLDGSHYQEKKFIAPEASVLVVDDNLMNLKVVEGLLRPYRIKVFVATSGKEALSKVESMKYDVIFMDHMMPEMDGVETAHNIRKKPGIYYQNVPIVALTANAIGGAREMFLAEGFQDYVAKPIELSHLERVLRKYIPEDKIKKTDEAEVIVPEQHSVTEEKKETGMEGASCLDRKKGIRYCGGSETDYEEILQIYYDTGLQKLKEIRQKYEEQDWKNYTILVHALKSTSISIGAEYLGEMAKQLEAAGKEENSVYILKHHTECMQEYKKVLKEIGGEDIRDTESEAGETDRVAVVKAETSPEKQELKELGEAEFLRQLDALSELLDTFEKEEVENKIDELSEYSYHGNTVKELLKTIKEQIEQFDFCSAAESLEQLRKREEKENE